MTSTRPRLQQQPVRSVDRQQQQSSGSSEFQPRAAQQGDAPPSRTSQATEPGYERRREQDVRARQS